MSMKSYAHSAISLVIGITIGFGISSFLKSGSDIGGEKTFTISDEATLEKRAECRDVARRAYEQYKTDNETSISIIGDPKYGYLSELDTCVFAASETETYVSSPLYKIEYFFVDALTNRELIRYQELPPVDTSVPTLVESNDLKRERYRDLYGDALLGE